jgi:bacteriorhodopsin
MELSSSVTNWLWIGFFGMLVGTALIYLLGSKLKPNQKYHVYLAMIITSIATIAYYAMANGQGLFMVNGKEVFVARYIDWVLTTPLLLLSLLLVAYPAGKDAAKLREKVGLFSTVIFADIVMIVTGLFANLSSNPDTERFWFVLSCIGFLVVIWQMYGPVRDHAKTLGQNASKFYTNLLTYLMVLWFIYPIVWLFGNSGYDKISLGAEVALYAVLDLCAKAVFGIFIVLNLRGLKNVD